jgi:hypothetical protein
MLSTFGPVAFTFFLHTRLGLEPYIRGDESDDDDLLQGPPDATSRAGSSKILSIHLSTRFWFMHLPLRVAWSRQAVVGCPCAAGSQGMLDQEAYEHGKHTRNLEWFRPPERKILHPLCVVLLVILRELSELERALCPSVRPPFYRLKGSVYTERDPDWWTRRYIK